MNKSKNDETDMDCEAARRALDYYLNPPPPSTGLDTGIWTIRDDVTFEQATHHAIALLKCAVGSAAAAAANHHALKDTVNGFVQLASLARTLLEQRPSPYRSLGGDREA